MRDLEIEKALDVEKALLELVKSRQIKVERLQRELDALRAHKKLLTESFSVPTFPPGYDPVTGCLEGAAVVSECVIENDATKAGDKNVSTPSRRASARGLKQRQSPSSKRRNEIEFADDADERDEVVPESYVRNTIPTETLSSSTSASNSEKAGNVMDWAHDVDLDLLKDEIRRERPGLKSPRKSPAKPLGISTRIPEKKIETVSSSNDDSESSDEESSSNEGSASESEDSKSKSRKAKPADSNPEVVSSQGVSSSSASESLTKQKPSLAKMKRDMSGETVKITWQPKSKAPSSSSEDSEMSSSSSDDDTARNSRHALTGRAPLGRAKESEVPKAVLTTSLSSDASSEDLFDWIILGLQGPWLPLASDEKASAGSELKEQSSLPLKFPAMSAYVAIYQKLIGEEAKAILLSEWEQHKAEQDLNTQAMTESPNENCRGQSSVWQLRSMVQTVGDPFHYFEADWVKGPNVKFDAGEFLCMIVPNTKEVKAVAIVNYQDRYQAPLLRTRAPWNFSLGKCVLLRLCNMVTLRRMFLAVSTISEIFSPLQQQILDPLANIKFLKSPPALGDAASGDPMVKLSSESLRNFSDRKVLNTLQLLTVSSLLRMRQGFQLVQGPPGTGKTSTIVGMVSTLLIEEPGVRILVCAPSNAALDEIAARLMHSMVDKSGNTYSPMDGTLVRFGAKRVMHSIVQLISLENLTLRLSSSSHRSRSWVDILDGASVVCATLSGCGNTTFDELEKMFDVVIIDEAAQAVEAEVLIALKRVRGRCVLVGDPKQLPATVFQRPGTAYGRSLFERFQEGGVPVHMLTTQYRMHPSICLYPSQQFYGGALKDSVRTSSMQPIFSQEVCGRGITVRGCRFKLGHYCFMDVGWGIEREELVGHSRANFEEALVVCNIVEGVVKGLQSGLKPNVGVITPYIAQRGMIEGQLERRGIDSTACEVNTVDGFQGREKDVIVLSCVRAMADRGLGFVSDERRMNVALTRAKCSLIIVGHAETLEKWSPAWGSLIDDARKRGCYQVLSKNKNQDISGSKSWKQSHSPRTDLYGTVEVENPPQVSRKRRLTSPEGEHSHKKVEYSEPMTSDSKSFKNVDRTEDSGKADEVEEHAQKLSSSSRKFYRAGVEGKLNRKIRVKRKREVLEAEDGKKTSVGLENALKSVLIKKLKVKENILESPTLKEKKAKVANNLPNFVGHPKKKKEVQKCLSESPILKNKKMKKVKVELDVAEPSVTKRPQKKKEVKQEFSTVEKRKTKAGEGSPALTSAPTRKVSSTANLSESPLRSMKKPEERTESLPKSPTERTKVGASQLLLKASVKKEEVTVYEVTFSALGGDGETKWRSSDTEEFGKSQIPDETPANPQGTDNRSMGNQRRSRGWFPNSRPKGDSPLSKQPPSGSAQSKFPASSTQGFANSDQYAAASKQPHWGNSYADATSPHHRFQAQGLNTSTDNMASISTRGNNCLGTQFNSRGNFQEPINHWQHPNSAQIPLHRNQFSGLQHQNSDQNQSLWSPRLTHSAPSRFQRGGTARTSQSAASAPHRKKFKGHAGKFNSMHSYPDR